MLLYPAVGELLKNVDCRYTLVVETAKRARQLVDGAPKLTSFNGSTKPVTIAVHEISEGLVYCDRSKNKEQADE